MDVRIRRMEKITEAYLSHLDLPAHQRDEVRMGRLLALANRQRRAIRHRRDSRGLVKG